MYIFTIDIYLEVVVFFFKRTYTLIYIDLCMHILNINTCTQTDTHIYIIHNII